MIKKVNGMSRMLDLPLDLVKCIVLGLASKMAKV